METPVQETKIIGNKKIEISYDDMAMSPDDWGCEDQFVIFDHRDFCVQRDGIDGQEIFEAGEKLKGYHIFRCYAYIHSGVALSVGSHNFPDARWDVSFKGFWVIKRQKGTWTREQAKKAAEGLCDSWNQYLSGDVYYYNITDVETDEVIDSCGGFYGLDECMEEATAMATD